MKRHHRIDYIEFSVTNMDQAKKFYTGAFGWEFTDYAPSYSGIKGDTDGHEVGGLSLVEENSPGGPLIVLFSEDLEASYAAVTQAGGEIIKEIFEFPGGKRFEFHDPSNNHLAVWANL